MKIVVDGLPQEVPEGASVAEVLRILDEPVTQIVVEVNGTYVNPQDYEKLKLRAGDRLEVIHPAFGG